MKTFSISLVKCRVAPVASLIEVTKPEHLKLLILRQILAGLSGFAIPYLVQILKLPVLAIASLFFFRAQADIDEPYAWSSYLASYRNCRENAPQFIALQKALHLYVRTIGGMGKNIELFDARDVGMVKDDFESLPETSLYNELSRWMQSPPRDLYARQLEYERIATLGSLVNFDVLFHRYVPQADWSRINDEYTALREFFATSNKIREAILKRGGAAVLFDDEKSFQNYLRPFVERQATLEKQQVKKQAEADAFYKRLMSYGATMDDLALLRKLRQEAANYQVSIQEAAAVVARIRAARIEAGGLGQAIAKHSVRFRLHEGESLLDRAIKVHPHAEGLTKFLGCSPHYREAKIVTDCEKLKQGITANLRNYKFPEALAQIDQINLIFDRANLFFQAYCE